MGLPSGGPLQRNWERAVIWVVVGLLVAASLLVGYAATPYTVPALAVQEIEATPAVTLTTLAGGGYVTAPADGPSDRGLVFYPGGRVRPNAYVPVLAPVVERTGVTVYIPQPPLNLAVLDSDMAASVSDASSVIDTWSIGGHSLGGAMACRFLHRNPDRVSGLLLFAAYCDRDISDADVRVLSVRGSRDTVLDRSAAERTRDNLPADGTTTVVIEGMNHSQLGAYRGQRGDEPATIPYARAHAELRDVVVPFLVEGNATAAS